MSRRGERGAVLFRGGISFHSAYQGVSQINSGQTSVTVSAAGVSSNNKPIMVFPYQINSGQITSSGSPHLFTNSVVKGVSFMVLTAGAVAPTHAIPFSYVILR